MANNIKNLTVINWLLSFIRPLKIKVTCAVLLGIVSNLSVIGISLVGTLEMLKIVKGDTSSVKSALVWLLLLGVLRGVARYSEQYLNHDIAFSLLANIRATIFRTLRKLGPAKLTGKNSGDLITAITSDVEALEVFFAHTVSPVFIAIGTSIVTVTYLSSRNLMLGLILLVGHLLVGVAVPVYSYLKNQQLGLDYQYKFSELNQKVMEDVESLHDIRQFGLEKEKLRQLRENGEELNQAYAKKLTQGSHIQIFSELGLMVTTLCVMLVGNRLKVDVQTMTLGVVLCLSSFGSVFALSGLGHDLLATFASGKRLYALTTEQPEVTFEEGDETEGKETFERLSLHKIDFSHDNKEILEEVSLEVPQGSVIGIGGESGSGKSTLLKLLMRYWNPNQGNLIYNGRSLSKMSEQQLHGLESVMEQSTFIFADTIAANIGLGKLNPTAQEIEEAAKKAAIHHWIMNLPDKYETKIGGNDRQISDGERQRIGLARIFLHDGQLLLLDEPTSSLDYMNEKAILETIKAVSKGKTALIVSHRETTLALAKERYLLTDKTLIKQ